MLQNELKKLVRQNIDAGLFPACSIGVITPDVRFTLSGGTLTYDDPTLVKDDSIFDVASITKSIPTTCLALKLLEDGKLKLTDELGEFLPEYRKPKGDAITIWNLLTQTVYYDYGHPLATLSHKSPEEIMAAIFKAPAKTSTSHVTYTNTSSILLGLVIEEIYGKKLPIIAEEELFRPLDMKRTGFEPLKLAGRQEIVPTEADGRGGFVHGRVHDESTRALLPNIVGAAGLFSTAPDLLRFMEMLLSGGRLGGRRYFHPETIGSMAANQLGGGESMGLGWALNQPETMGRYAKDVFGKTGFTGCIFLCSPSLNAGLVILTNHVHPKRRDSFEPINRFRRQVADAVFGSV